MNGLVGERELSSLFGPIDEVLLPARFSRRQSAPRYERKVEEATHRLDVAIQRDPRYAPESIAHVLPTIRIGFPKVTERALEMVGNGRLLAGAPDVVLMVPLQSIVSGGREERWLASGEGGLSEVGASIARVLVSDGMPFMDGYICPGDLLRGYEAHDPRLLLQQHTYLFVCAAYLVVGNTTGAQAVLERHLGSAGLKKRYAAAHSFVERLARA